MRFQTRWIHFHDITTLTICTDETTFRMFIRSIFKVNNMAPMNMKQLRRVTITVSQLLMASLKRRQMDRAVVGAEKGDYFWTPHLFLAEKSVRQSYWASQSTTHLLRPYLFYCISNHSNTSNTEPAPLASQKIITNSLITTEFEHACSSISEHFIFQVLVNVCSSNGGEISSPVGTMDLCHRG
jgi:hypothetical protein